MQIPLKFAIVDIDVHGSDSSGETTRACSRATADWGNTRGRILLDH
jgi:hypothetical protein